jgi:outer membrane murein-binding lipoprotein Lpp
VKHDRPAPPEDEPPRHRGSLPSLDLAAGPVKLLARGGPAVYGGVLAAVAIFGMYHYPEIMAAWRESTASAREGSTAARELGAAMRELTPTLRSMAEDAREARASAGRIEAQLGGLATKADVEALRADVRAGCPGRRP